MTKRKKYLLAASIVLTVVLWMLRIAVIEPAMLHITECTVALDRLPPEHDGLVVAVIADLHLRRSSYKSGLLDRVTEELRKRRPDIVLLGGDYVDARTPASLLEVDRMGQLVTKWHGQYGTFAVAGNHDIYREKDGIWAFIAKTLRKGGVTVLDGWGVSVDVRGKPFQIAGCGDRTDAWFRMGCMPEFDRSLPVYGLIHQPVYLYSARNSFDMIFSAHTHRGQIRFPVFGEYACKIRFRTGWLGCGLRRHRNCVQFVTSGLGMSTYPLRWHNVPEIAFITLRRPVSR